MDRKLTDENIAPADLNIDREAYQRCIIQRQVRYVVKNLDMVAFGRILVGKRADGSKWVVDGQQRLTAAIELKMQTVPCVMFQSEGRADEAAMFVKYNANRAGVSPMDVFKAAVTAGDKTMVAIQACTESCGYKICRGGSTPNAIQAVGQLITIWRGGGEPMLRLTLNTVREVWGEDKDSVHNLVLDGLSSFLHKSNGAHSQSRLIKVLKAVNPLDLQRFAKDSARISGRTSAGTAFATAILTIYNKGLRNNRLVFEKVNQDAQDEAN